MKTNKCIEKIQNYTDKLENHTDKLAEIIGDTDNVLIQQCIDENEKVFYNATECCSDLKQFKEWLVITKAKLAESPKEKIEFTQIVNLQKEMQSMMLSQLKQQHEFLERQKEEEKQQNYQN